MAGKKESKYAKVGNVEYTHEPRIVKPFGLITTPKLVLKYYGMHKKGQDFKKVDIKLYKDLTKYKIKSKNIKPLSGLGFAILSDEVLNVSVWDKNEPIILKNNLFSYIDGQATKLDVNKEGPFCIWELRVVNFEKELWMDYLQSKRKESNKRKYLDSRINWIL